MDQNMHKRARQLMADAMLGLLEEADHRRLEEHLAECAECSGAAAAMREAVTTLRSVPVHADAALVQATRRSVRLYAERLRESESRMRMMLVSSAVAAVVGAVSLPFLFRLFAWVGGRLQLSEPAVWVAVLAFWLLPGLLAALALSRRPAAHLPLAHDGPETRRNV